MTPEHKTLVQETWQRVAPTADEAAHLFYDRLFEIDATTRPLFASTDLVEQRRKLVQALTLVVRALDHPEALAPTLADLGQHHARYGVTDEHYDTVGAALLWTLEQRLGAAWTPQTKAAWSGAYAHLSEIMRSAGRRIDVNDCGSLDAGQPELDPDSWSPRPRRT
ncbi:MAG TPA: globin family protein [Steroidobacteraceae bacterium]|jgi:hemoglobin-like flavoprotein|nr:globin family protein [Steroidobacteraceae bacterium]